LSILDELQENHSGSAESLKVAISQLEKPERILHFHFHHILAAVRSLPEQFELFLVLALG